jgi:hypothetical protein
MAVTAGSEGLHAGSGHSVLHTASTMLGQADWAVSPALDAASIVRTLTEIVS